MKVCLFWKISIRYTTLFMKSVTCFLRCLITAISKKTKPNRTQIQNSSSVALCRDGNIRLQPVVEHLAAASIRCWGCWRFLFLFLVFSFRIHWSRKGDRAPSVIFWLNLMEHPRSSQSDRIPVLVAKDLNGNNSKRLEALAQLDRINKKLYFVRGIFKN